MSSALRCAFAVAVALTLGTAPLAADPATDYLLHCRGCHGPAGGGTPPDVPDLRGAIGQFTSTPAGREYLIRVPGVSQAELSDARIATLLTWLVQYYDAANIPAGFEPFSAAEVRKHRRPPLSDPAATRAALLRAAAGD